MKTCPTPTKFPIPTYNAAIHYAVFWGQQYNKELYVRPCTACGVYHLTKNAPAKREKQFQQDQKRQIIESLGKKTLVFQEPKFYRQLLKH